MLLPVVVTEDVSVSVSLAVSVSESVAMASDSKSDSVEESLLVVLKLPLTLFAVVLIEAPSLMKSLPPSDSPVTVTEL
jgi:hypothetical protein